MTYKLKFIPQALKEWKKLDPSVQNQFKKKLLERLVNPHVPSNLLHGFDNHYKIKLRASGFRIVYEVVDSEICVIVIAVGKRDRNTVYKQALRRSKNWHDMFHNHSLHSLKPTRSQRVKNTRIKAKTKSFCPSWRSLRLGERQMPFGVIPCIPFIPVKELFLRLRSQDFLKRIPQIWCQGISAYEPIIPIQSSATAIKTVLSFIVWQHLSRRFGVNIYLTHGR